MANQLVLVLLTKSLSPQNDCGNRVISNPQYHKFKSCWQRTHTQKKHALMSISSACAVAGANCFPCYLLTSSCQKTILNGWHVLRNKLVLLRLQYYKLASEPIKYRNWCLVKIKYTTSLSLTTYYLLPTTTTYSHYTTPTTYSCMAGTWHHLPSGYLTVCYGKSSFSSNQMGQDSIASKYAT